MRGLQILFISIFCLFQPLLLWGQDSSITPEEEARAVEYFIMGISEFENEEYERALDHLTAAHLKLSEHAGVNYALADVYLATGDLINAAYYGQMAANLEPENKWYHLKLAEIYRRGGRNEATVEAYERALEFHPNDPDILFDLAETYMNFGELLKANHMYDRIMNIRGSEFEIHLRKYQNFNALKMRDSALVQLEIMREINPGNLSTLHTLSQYHLELDDEETARNILLEAHKRNARDPQTLILLADIYIRNSEWENLGEAFSIMLRDPLIYPSQKLELVRFVYQEYQKQPDEPVLQEQTRNLILEFSKNEPEYAPAQMIASDFFLQVNEPVMALEMLERINSAIPEEQDPWRQRMQILFTMQEYQEVISLSGQAVEFVPDDAHINFFTGASFMLTGETEKAEEWLEEASAAPARRTFRSVIYSTLGDVKQDLDKWDEAVQAYERAIRLDPGNHNAMNNYAYFLSVRDERLEDARELSETALQMEPDNTSYLDTMGWIFYKLGNYERALEYIQRAADNDDASAEVFEHLGYVYDKKGDRQQAADWWERAIEKDSTREYLKERIQTRD